MPLIRKRRPGFRLLRRFAQLCADPGVESLIQSREMSVMNNVYQ